MEGALVVVCELLTRMAKRSTTEYCTINYFELTPAVIIETAALVAASGEIVA